MAFKVFNKYKAPKYTEFSRKDFVVDIKNGHLYFKSNLGVHKVGSYLDVDIFGLVPTILEPTSDFQSISVQQWALINGLNVYGTASLAGPNTYLGGDWVNDSAGNATWVPNCSDNVYIGGEVTAYCDISSSGYLNINTANNSDTSFKTLVIDPATGRIYRTGSYGGSGGGGSGGDITAVNITAGAGIAGSQNTATGDHNQTLSIGGGTGITVLANGIAVNPSDFILGGTDNYVITATGDPDVFQAEAGMQYDSDINSLNLSGSFTASSNISSSGLLYVSASHTASIFENVAIYDSASGRLYYTSSVGFYDQL